MKTIPDGWSYKSLYDCVIGSSLRNTDNRLKHDDLRSVNKTLGMVYMKDQVKGKTVDRCKIVKNNWFAYNPMRLNVGSICRWNAKEECLVSPDYVVFYCNENLLLTEYFDHLRRSHKWNDFMVRAGNGSVRVRIYLKDLAPLQVVLPPITEQNKIAKILSTWDRAIEVTEKLLKNSQQQKKSLMQQLLTGKKRLIGFGGEWEKVTLGNIATLKAGGTPSTRKQEYWGGNVPWMSSGEINYRRIFAVNGRITKEGLQNSSARMLPKHSVLIALAGQGKTRGKVAINEIPLCTNQSVAAITPNNKIHYEFLFHNIDRRYDEIRSMSYGDGGRGGLNLSILKSIKIKLPSIDEQQKISLTLSTADKEIETIQQKLECLRQEKKALMQQLLTGKRRVQVDMDKKETACA